MTWPNQADAEATLNLEPLRLPIAAMVQATLRTEREAIERWDWNCAELALLQDWRIREEAMRVDQTALYRHAAEHWKDAGNQADAPRRAPPTSMALRRCCRQRSRPLGRFWRRALLAAWMVALTGFGLIGGLCGVVWLALASTRRRLRTANEAKTGPTLPKGGSMQDKAGRHARAHQRETWAPSHIPGRHLGAQVSGGEIDGIRQHAAQRRWDQRRAKTRLNLRLSPQTRAALLAAARERRVPACDLAERLISAGLQQGAVRQLQETALPQLAEAVRLALEEHARHTEDRLAKLLTRNIIASDTTRRLLFAHMARQWGGGEQIRQAHDSARTASINALRERGWVAALRLDVEELAE